jgi:hypothetical protein
MLSSISASSGVHINANSTRVDENPIHDNMGNGIGVLSGAGNEFLGNSIFDNGGLGIDLNLDGPTTQAVLIANNNQRHPQITRAEVTSPWPVGGAAGEAPNRLPQVRQAG